MVMLFWHIATAVVALNAVNSFAAPLGVDKPLPRRPLPEIPLKPVRRKPSDAVPLPAEPTSTSRLSKFSKAAKKETSLYPVGTILGTLGVLSGISIGAASLWHSYNTHRRDVTELEDSGYRREFEDELD